MDIEIIIAVFTAAGAGLAAFLTGFFKNKKAGKDTELINLEKKAIPVVLKDLSRLFVILEEIDNRLLELQEITSDLKYIKSFCYKNINALEEGNKRLEEIKDYLDSQSNYYKNQKRYLQNQKEYREGQREYLQDGSP